MGKVSVQSAVLPHIELELHDVDADGMDVVRTYKLCYDYRAIKRAEEVLGLDLKDFSQWKDVKSSMTPQLIHAGLAKFHPEVTQEEILDLLNPSAQSEIQSALFEYLFPGVLEKIKKIQAEAQDEPKNVLSEAAQNA